MRTFSFFLLAALSLVLAQDEGESSKYDIEIDDIDIGGPGGAQTSSFSGNVNQHTEKVGINGIPVTITHLAGPITVRCADTDVITARIDYTLEGTNRNNIETMSKGIKLSASGNATSATVKSIAPAKPAGVTSADIPLVVSIPKMAKLTISGRDGAIVVDGCTGTVKATTSKGGIRVNGDYSSFNLSAADGDVKLDLASSSKITGASAMSAAKGNASLSLPISQDAKLVVTGAEVSVTHSVMGTNTDTSVSGTIGAGGPVITVKAKGKAEITAP